MISIFHIGTFVNYTLPPNSLNKQIELVLRLIYPVWRINKNYRYSTTEHDNGVPVLVAVTQSW